MFKLKPLTQSLLNLSLGLMMGLTALPAAAETGLEPLVVAYQNQDVINRFYTAFANHDAHTMAQLYHPEVEFSDPVFGTLRGPAVSAMWTMLIEAGSHDLTVRHDQVLTDAKQGQARWQAWYGAPLTGFPVHNVIQARFEFKDGLIYRHHDSFDMNVWACQALGAPGCLIGAGFQGLISGQAQRRLADWMRAHPDGRLPESIS